MTIIIFKVSEKLFGLSSRDVIEILPILELSNAGENTRGYDAVFNLRGEIVPALNLRRWFGIDIASLELWNNILVVENAGAKFGLVVDKVIDVISFDEEYKNSTLNWTKLDKTDVFYWDQSIVTMLELKQVLKASRIRQKAEAV